MTYVKDLKKICGYERGNVSPLGMRGSLITVFDESALSFERIYISAGKIGTQVCVNPVEIIKLINARTSGIV